ncbi:gamma-glutamyl-gamma-aminobutyrate hydrolase family protein [Anaerolinea sp.]|uniref:gamma-glutamyl-gamma-aminobutyrate hydrolase family protein n=1 Tax=Anaerolinea sp. TaxID=1872519 RepID=UPI002ACE4C30|nr:gamma-glutamyl-gamma-aminobutyrate hydrolase family protein [Anaerolinea sp.]
MTLPLIGITSIRKEGEPGQTHWYSTPFSYIHAVQRAGGMPVLIPPVYPAEQLPALLQRLDGVLLIGGGDIDPNLYGGEPHPRVYDIQAERDSVEITLVHLALETSTPLLGICRGAQVMNVALGGTLYSDIADQKPGALKHDYYPDFPRNTLAHAVEIEAQSRLAQMLGGTHFEVNSLHHQGISKVASSLRVTAHAPDGLVEAVEVEGHPFAIGVQWHPEWLQEHAPQRALFSAFIRAASQRK